MQEPKLLIKTGNKRWRRAHAPGCLHNGAVQLEHQRRDPFGDVRVELCGGGLEECGLEKPVGTRDPFGRKTLTTTEGVCG